MVNKDFSLRDMRMDLGRRVVVMSVNPLMWQARCLCMDMLRRKACNISLFVRGHCDKVPLGHFM